jgi:hypothetical protein
MDQFAGDSREPTRGGVFRGTGPAVAIIAKSYGALAWITENGRVPVGVPATDDVHANDKSGSRLLASGSNIAPHSLARGGFVIEPHTVGRWPVPARRNPRRQDHDPAIECRAAKSSVPSLTCEKRAGEMKLSERDGR